MEVGSEGAAGGEGGGGVGPEGAAGGEGGGSWTSVRWMRKVSRLGFLCKSLASFLAVMSWIWAGGDGRSSPRRWKGAVTVLEVQSIWGVRSVMKGLSRMPS